MDDITKRKLQAAGKMALGGGRVLSGIAMASGHGLLGGFFRSHGNLRAAQAIARHTIPAGARTFRDGLEDWRAA